MTESESLWNEEQLLIEMEMMQDQIDSLIQEKREWERESLQKQQTIYDLSSQVSLLKSELQKSSEKNKDLIRRLNETNQVLAENSRLKKEISDLQLDTERTKKEYEIMARNFKAVYSQKENNLLRRIADTKRRADRKYKKMRDDYNLLLVLISLYSIIITLITAMIKL